MSREAIEVGAFTWSRIQRLYDGDGVTHWQRCESEGPQCPQVHTESRGNLEPRDRSRADGDEHRERSVLHATAHHSNRANPTTGARSSPPATDHTVVRELHLTMRKKPRGLCDTVAGRSQTLMA
jgi:hypothetical protein